MHASHIRRTFTLITIDGLNCHWKRLTKKSNSIRDGQWDERSKKKQNLCTYFSLRYIWLVFFFFFISSVYVSLSFGNRIESKAKELNVNNNTTFFGWIEFTAAHTKSIRIEKVEIKKICIWREKKKMKTNKYGKYTKWGGGGWVHSTRNIATQHSTIEYNTKENITL